MHEGPAARRLSGAEFTELVESGASPQQLAAALLAGGAFRAKSDPLPKSSMLDTGPESLDVESSPVAALTMLYMDGKIDDDVYREIVETMQVATDDVTDADK